MEQPWVAIILPSRGLIFSRVIAYVEDVRATYPHIRIFTSDSLPIPDCFNTPTVEAFADPKFSYFWYIEEDTVPPVKTLDLFFEAMKEYDIAAVDYGFNGGYNTIARSRFTNEILFTGFGCTFMKRAVLEKMPRPYFRADRAFNISNMQWYPVDPLKAYGMYDIDWASRVKEAGFTITQVEGECRHLQLIALGQKESNNGCHVIGEKDHITKKLLLPMQNI